MWDLEVYMIDEGGFLEGYLVLIRFGVAFGRIRGWESLLSRRPLEYFSIHFGPLDFVCETVMILGGFEIG